MDSPIIINWTSPLSFLGAAGVGLDSEKRLFLRKDAKRGKMMGKEAVVSIKVVYFIQT